MADDDDGDVSAETVEVSEPRRKSSSYSPEEMSENLFKVVDKFRAHNSSGAAADCLVLIQPEEARMMMAAAQYLKNEALLRKHDKEQLSKGRR